MGIVKGVQGQGLDITQRVPTERLWELLNVPAVGRADYLARFEAGYNFGPGAFPPQVFVELTSYCNLKCTFCHYPDMQRPHEHMDRALARRVIDECAAAGVWYLTFQFYGEPLLCPDLIAEMTRYAKDRGVPVVATTSNMTLMTEPIMRQWIEAGLDTLNVSFDGSTPEKYREIRGRDYHQVLERIRLARRVRDEAGRGRPFISMTLVRTDETDAQLQRFHDEMSAIVDALDIRSMMLFNYRAKDTAKYEQSVQGWYVLRDFTKRIPCRQIGSKLIVTAQGDVTVCCTDIDAELSLGNVRQTSLRTMWQSDAFARLYMVHRQQRWGELPAICRDCKDWDWQGAQPDWEARDARWKGSRDAPDDPTRTGRGGRGAPAGGPTPVAETAGG
jgi:radical SAM protein with 4Fe4S-binding SPASM domain